MKPSNYYFIADTHFEHQMMLDKGFRRIKDQNSLVTSLLKLTDKDVLFHLGDICVSNDMGVHNHLIKEIKAKKILIKGNHDSKSLSWYYTNGWDSVVDRLDFKYLGFNFILTHMAIDCIDESYDDEISNINIHGHSHTDTTAFGEDHPFINLVYANIVPELWGYFPISLPNLLNGYHKFKRRIDTCLL